MMREKKKMDEEQRGQLLALYGSYKKLLSTMDEKMRKHVEKKGEAEPEQEMEKYLAQLKVTAHKLIVAGRCSFSIKSLLYRFSKGRIMESTVKLCNFALLLFG